MHKGRTKWDTDSQHTGRHPFFLAHFSSFQSLKFNQNGILNGKLISVVVEMDSICFEMAQCDPVVVLEPR